MRVIFVPFGCNGDMMIVETDNIVLTDDILSYSDCNEDCEHCIAIKIPGIIFNYCEDGESMTAIYPVDIGKTEFIAGCKNGMLDLTHFNTFVDDSPEEIMNYVNEVGIFLEGEKSNCYEKE